MSSNDYSTGAVQTNTGPAREKATTPVVLQVVPSLNTGGVERGAIDIAAAITKAGGTAIVASEGGSMAHELTRAGALHITLPLASKNLWVMYRNIGRLARIIVAHQVDIVHARSRAPAWSARAAAKRTGRHFVTTFHGTYNIENRFKRRYNAIMTTGERVIANSHFIAQHIRENYNVSPSRLRVIQRGVDLQRFDPEKVSAERVIKLATDWRLPDGVPVVMLPGRLTRWKGQRLLIEALALLSDIELRGIIIGADQGRVAYRRELETLIERLGLSSKVHILDHCNDMAAAYMQADVVVSASTDPEGFGRVVSEGQAMGRPVVASDHGGVREQVIEGHTAFLFPPGDAAALSEAIRKALSLTAEERDKLAQTATRHARENFSKDRMCAVTLDLYKELLRADAYMHDKDSTA